MFHDSLIRPKTLQWTYIRFGRISTHLRAVEVGCKISVTTNVNVVQIKICQLSEIRILKLQSINL